MCFPWFLMFKQLFLLKIHLLPAWDLIIIHKWTEKRSYKTIKWDQLDYLKSISTQFWLGKKLKSVFDFLTYLRETGFSFSYGEVENLHRPNEIDRVSKFDNSLSFGAKQNALQQIFFALWFFLRFFYEKWTKWGIELRARD